MLLHTSSAVTVNTKYEFKTPILNGSVYWSWVVGRGFQVVGRGFQVVGRGFQVVGHGFQVVGRGSWVIDWKGSALARRRFFGIPSNSKQSLQQQIRHVF